MNASPELGSTRREQNPDSRRGLFDRTLRLGLLRTLLRFFFRHLYTTFAWAYDAVAWATSMGQWRTWQTAVVDRAQARPALELGHGPGHLLLELRLRGGPVAGLDRSAQMTRMAARRLRRHGLEGSVVRADARSLPFASESFPTICATFPSDYILDQRVLREVRRVLDPGGSFVVIPSAEITGSGPGDRFAAWLFRVTGQAGDPERGWVKGFGENGFDVDIERVIQPRAVVLRLVARKSTVPARPENPESPVYNP